MESCKEAEAAHNQFIPVKGSIDYEPPQRRFPPKKHKGRIILIVVQLLVIIALIGALIALSRRKCTDDVSETRSQKSAPCEDDWIRYRGKCYFFSTEEASWNQTQKFCKSHGASLALIDNREELDFLFQRKGPGNLWIGLRRTDDNTAWIWTNGTLYNESLFPITGSSDTHIEYAYLNNYIVKCEGGGINYKWICNKT